MTPYRSSLSADDGFGRLVHSEWTKLRTARAWMVTVVIAVLVMVLFGWLSASGSHAGFCEINRSGQQTCHGEPNLPTGPGGEAIADTFYFVHQPLTGAGSVTVRVTSLTGVVSTAGNRVEVGSDPLAQSRRALPPWAKAGVIIKQNLTPGSPYAAVMVTGSHGVRMQDNFTHDSGGVPGAVSPTSPRWLRLTRAANSLTGYDSTDGVHWTQIGSVRLNLTSTVQVGVFVTSPVAFQSKSSDSSEPSLATATFDHITLQSRESSGHWTGTSVGAGPAGYPSLANGDSRSAGDRLTVSGSGDIAPAVLGGIFGGGAPITNGLLGAFAGLIAVSILGALFVTSEYRRGLIRTTLALSPRRGRVLTAKAIVLGGVTFVAGLVGAIATTAISRSVLRHNGNALFPVSTVTEIRVIVGTAALMAAAAVLALALGTMLRRSTGAVLAVTAALVLPYILGLTLTGSAANWLMRLTPAAGFAIQQAVTRYPQVDNSYRLLDGYFPLPIWLGFGVLLAYVAVAVGVAAMLLRRRDA